MIPRLILLNGSPGIGKSTLARLYAADHPLMLALDIDAIRTSMGGWQRQDESKQLARLATMPGDRPDRAGDPRWQQSQRQE